MKRFYINAGMLLFGVIAMIGCNNKPAVQLKKAPPGGTYASRHGASLQVTRSACGQVMKAEGGSPDDGFVCFRITWTDSVVVASQEDKKKEIAEGQYYQYQVGRDWRILNKGDSLKPVFFQNLNRNTMDKRELILVFEKDKTGTADTLVYTDSFGEWGRQIFTIANK